MVVNGNMLKLKFQFSLPKMETRKPAETFVFNIFLVFSLGSYKYMENQLALKICKIHHNQCYSNR